MPRGLWQLYVLFRIPIHQKASLFSKHGQSRKEPMSLSFAHTHVFVFGIELGFASFR